jgi:hypothetical protein
MMPAGPGKYDDLATEARTRAQARAAIVIIVGGTKGSGFSVQVEDGVILSLPAVLRMVADEIDAGSGHG